MRACVGDFVKYKENISDDECHVFTIAEVIGISDCIDGTEEYDLHNGITVHEYDLDVDSVLLASEVLG